MQSRCRSAGSLFFFGASDFAHRLGYSSDRERWLATTAAAAGYLITGVLAIRDIRASSLLAVPLCLVSTPLFALVWLFSQWTQQGSEAAHPLFYYMGGNVILIHAAIWALVRAMRQRQWLATQ